jgi:hypothetical protein
MKLDRKIFKNNLNFAHEIFFYMFLSCNVTLERNPFMDSFEISVVKDEEGCVLEITRGRELILNLFGI